ncbi:MAG TPA: hypothetical protein VF937_01015 [Chloroflexota bacterium]
MKDRGYSRRSLLRIAGGSTLGVSVLLEGAALASRELWGQNAVDAPHLELTHGR